MNENYNNWYAEMIYHFEVIAEVTTSDAQGITDLQESYLQEAWYRGISAKDTAEIVYKRCIVSNQ